MQLHFEVSCQTRWGEEVFVDIDGRLLKLHINEDLRWVGSFQVAISNDKLRYQYVIIEDDRRETEFGGYRELNDLLSYKSLLLRDQWRSNQALDNPLYSAPFFNAFFKRSSSVASQKAGKTTFRLREVRVSQDHQIGILGSCPELGNWSEKEVILLRDSHFPFWEYTVELKDSCEYKYVIHSTSEKRIVKWEEGENRKYETVDSGINKCQISDEYFRYPGLWKGAGVSLPVFSFRTKESAGVGEFKDISVLVDWAKKTGLKVIQVLPVNDTTAHHLWTDSYPYAAVSVHALHPIYANMEAIGPLNDKGRWKEIQTEAAKLNELKELDYVAVMKLKSTFFKYSYDENKASFLKSKELKSFLSENKSWIHDYAVFSCVRDRNKTPDFTKWKEHREMTEDQVKAFASPGSDDYDDVAVHYYIQYYLDKQLNEVSHYAREQGIILKGDIPIGIYRHSIDAWRKPHLFHLDKQAGAPPDMFSTTGQNWGFPTYNWEQMRKDGYAWWRDRLSKMSRYFDAIRIDHILGFFRIWQMNQEDVQGLLGTFYPALPMDKEEIRKWGIAFDEIRYCDPYLPASMITAWLGKWEELIKEHFFNVDKAGFSHFKTPFRSQRNISNRLAELVKEQKIEVDDEKHIRKLLFKMQSEVIFVRDDQPGYYHPRNELYLTESFNSLEESEKQQLRILHEHYFYHRHNSFWKENALKKLPVIISATDMLVCGEDLGMVPASVPGVMEKLQILRLFVDRNPNFPGGFKDPSIITYLSVKSTGNHDVETLRQWWEREKEKNSWIYRDILGMEGEVPDELTPEVAKHLIQTHFDSNAMFVINPLQDYLALSKDLRRDNLEEERINIPEDPHHAWRYRFHLNLEELLNATNMNEQINQLAFESGRVLDY